MERLPSCGFAGRRRYWGSRFRPSTSWPTPGSILAARQDAGGSPGPPHLDPPSGDRPPGHGRQRQPPRHQPRRLRKAFVSWLGLRRSGNQVCWCRRPAGHCAGGQPDTAPAAARPDVGDPSQACTTSPAWLERLEPCGPPGCPQGCRTGLTAAEPRRRSSAPSRARPAGSVDG